MFAPGLILILEENEFLNQELMIKNILDFLGLVSIAFIFCGFYGIISALKIPAFLNMAWAIFWNSLTPGQQWLEIAFIISNIITFISLMVFLTALTDNLDKKIIQMKKVLREREEKIAELELKINQQKTEGHQITDEELLAAYDKWVADQIQHNEKELKKSNQRQ